MYKREITYTDYNGVERTEDFYFNLTKAELMEMELGKEGGMAASLDRLIQAQNTSELIQVFKQILLASYGEKDETGKYFHKSAEISEKFSHTEAYSELFMQLANDAEAAAEFVNGVIPKELADNLSNDIAELETTKVKAE